MKNLYASVSNKGFTLIEVLVTVAVTGILTVLATVIFINTVRNSKKAEVTSEGRQNAAFVIDRLQKDTRSASSIALTGTGKMTITTSSGSEIVWLCHPENPPTDNGYISRDPDGDALPIAEITVTNRDTTDGVSVNNCAFDSTNPGNEKLVTIDFTINEGVGIQTGPQEYGVNLPFRTSVTARPNL